MLSKTWIARDFMVNKAPTIKEIAKIANLSAMTVSRALNDSPRVKAETRQKVLRIAKQLGYRPNRIARSLVSKRSNLISLMVADIKNQYFAELARGIEDSARKNGYNVIFCSTDYDPQILESSVRLMLEVGVDGFILAAVRLKEPIVEELAAQRFPMVLVNRELASQKATSVVIDNHEGAYLVVEHLIKCGYRRIGIITGSLDVSTGLERFEGYKKALLNHGIEYHEEYASKGPFTRAHGYQAAKQMLTLKRPPQAIFAASDNIALGVMNAAGSMHLKIPADLALVGFDDTEFSSHPRIELTTVSQKKYEMGSLSVHMLIDLIDRKGSEYNNKIVLKPQLIVRKSCGFHLREKMAVNQS
jgi:LacI family transcriptional regulator